MERRKHAQPIPMSNLFTLMPDRRILRRKN